MSSSPTHPRTFDFGHPFGPCRPRVLAHLVTYLNPPNRSSTQAPDALRPVLRGALGVEGGLELLDLSGNRLGAPGMMECFAQVRQGRDVLIGYSLLAHCVDGHAAVSIMCAGVASIDDVWFCGAGVDG